MVSPILLKRSTTSGVVPSSLAAGELAQNLPDEMLFYRNASGAVTKFKLPSAERLITSGSVNNVASLTLSVDPGVIGIFRAFQLYLIDWIGVSDNQPNFRIQLGDASGIYSGSSDYDDCWQVLSSDDYNGNYSNQTSSIHLLDTCNNQSPGNSRGGHLIMHMAGNDPSATMPNFIHWMGFVNSWNGTVSTYYLQMYWGCGRRLTRINLTQFKLSYSSGNISLGKYLLFGLP